MALGLPLALAFAGVLSAACLTPRPKAPKSDFVTVNGVRLHHVDWGGDGEWLLFLTANGGELVEQFGSLAPQFTDRFHVVGLTRRGTGPSEKPESGYDTDTLVGDIVGFLDAMGAPQANIAGHSVAGAEMTRLGGVHPSRVAKLVYLDAAVDYKLQAQLAAEAGLGPQPDHALAAILRGAGVRHPEYERLSSQRISLIAPGDGITLPVVVKEVKPDYPRDVLPEKAQGSVFMRLLDGSSSPALRTVSLSQLGSRLK